MTPALQTSVLLLAATVALVGGAGWSYTDEYHWGGVCQTGLKQSPIDLGPLSATVANYDKLSFSNYEAAAPLTLLNNGHTVKMQVQRPGSVGVSGGGLPGVYYLAQMHFHWGAEHTLQGRRPPLELHLVHYAKQYSGVPEASQYPQGLAVVGIHFKESKEENPHLQQLIVALKMVDDDVNSGVQLTDSPSHYLPADLKMFYRYQGSLTTPGCNETVVWTVMIATVPISTTQLQSFVTLRANSKPIGNNYRTIQPLHGRTVTTTLPGSSGAMGTAAPVTSLLLAFALALYAARAS